MNVSNLSIQGLEVTTVDATEKLQYFLAKQSIRRRDLSVALLKAASQLIFSVKLSKNSRYFDLFLK
jgi:hypothetical protein